MVTTILTAHNYFEFTHFTSFFNFRSNGDDFKNKEKINGVKVRVGI